MKTQLLQSPPDADGGGGNVNEKITMALNIASQINPIIGLAVLAINTYRSVRDAALAANPNLPEGTFKTDPELFGTLNTEAGLLRIDAAAAREWLKGLPQ